MLKIKYDKTYIEYTRTTYVFPALIPKYYRCVIFAEHLFITNSIKV